MLFWIILIAAGVFIWYKFFREKKEEKSIVPKISEAEDLDKRYKMKSVELMAVGINEFLYDLDGHVDEIEVFESGDISTTVFAPEKSVNNTSVELFYNDAQDVLLISFVDSSELDDMIGKKITNFVSFSNDRIIEIAKQFASEAKSCLNQPVARENMAEKRNNEEFARKKRQ